MNIDKKIIIRLQAMLAEYEKVNGTVSANMRDASNTGCSYCNGTCKTMCAIGCFGRCAGTTYIR